MTTAAGLGFPGSGRVETTFSLTMTGICAAKDTLTLTGNYRGFCGLAVGDGTSNHSPTHDFTFVVTTGNMAFSGKVTGSLAVIADPTHVGSCTNKTATRFLVTGALVLPPH